MAISWWATLRAQWIFEDFGIVHPRASLALRLRPRRHRRLHLPRSVLHGIGRPFQFHARRVAGAGAHRRARLVFAPLVALLGRRRAHSVRLRPADSVLHRGAGPPLALFAGAGAEHYHGLGLLPGSPRAIRRHVAADEGPRLPLSFRAALLPLIG